MAATAYLAFDLGAESGRAMLAELEGGKVTLTEVHRFLNVPQRLPSGLHWNLLELWANLVEGLRKGAAAAKERGLNLVSLGVDTWGVDFGLVGKSGQLLGLPFAYRDDRCAPAMKKAVAQLGEATIYDATGIQFMPFNSVYQLVAQRDAEPAVLEHAAKLLFMPDLLHYFFSGVAACEATIASTSQAIDPRTGKWATPLLKQLGLTPHDYLLPTVPAGTKIGTLRDEVRKATSAPALDVIVPGSHDTASAVAAVPVDDRDAASGGWAYLSSGTWSLMGAELDAPVVTEASRRAGFTNERGVAGRIRFLKNISGLWLVQELRRDYSLHGQEFDYATLTKLAEESEPFRTLVDADHEPFASPGDMRAKFDAFAQATGQPKPETPGQYVRCALESLAFTYRRVLGLLEELLGRRIDVLHIVGGGGRNALLNQMTADGIGRPVVVGPYEGTAMGNALTQAIGRGDLKDLAELRRVVRASTELVRVEPRQKERYDGVDARYRGLLGR